MNFCNCPNCQTNDCPAALEIEALQKDALKWRWLKVQTGIELDNARKGGKWAFRKAATNYEYSLHSTADEAIDAAMSAEKK